MVYISILVQFIECCSLQVYKRIDMELYIILTGVIWGLVNIFLYFYFGYLATESYRMISDCLYASNWYNRSLKYQKYKSIILMVLELLN